MNICPLNYRSAGASEYSNETLASLNIFQKFVLFGYVMALFKAVIWALIFLAKLRFPPGVSIACYCFERSLQE